MDGNNYNVVIDELLFEWDERKAGLNKSKHRLSFHEAKTVFCDENALLIYDPDHSEQDDRFILMGLSARARLVVVSHACRKDAHVIRIISARKATKREQRQYWQRWLE